MGEHSLRHYCAVCNTYFLLHYCVTGSSRETLRKYSCIFLIHGMRCVSGMGSFPTPARDVEASRLGYSSFRIQPDLADLGQRPDSATTSNALNICTCCMAWFGDIYDLKFSQSQTRRAEPPRYISRQYSFDSSPRYSNLAHKRPPYTRNINSPSATKTSKR